VIRRLAFCRRGLILSRSCLRISQRSSLDPFPLGIGGTLRTVLDVQDYLLNMPENRASPSRWEDVRQSLGTTAVLREFTRQVELALTLDRKLS
jgi:hypothetical protein